MITIYNNRIIYKHDKSKRKIDDNMLCGFLNESVAIDSKVTLERILHLLTLNKRVIDLLFFAGCDYGIEDFFNDMNSKMTTEQKKEKRGKNDYLEVYPVSDIWKFEVSERVEYNLYYGFHLIAPDDKEGVPYSILFSSLNTLKKLPVRIKSEFEVYINDTTKPVTKKNCKPVMDARLESMTLYNFIYGIVHEISWHGAPIRRDKVANDLFSRVYDTSDIKALKKGLKKKKSTLRG